MLCLGFLDKLVHKMYAQRMKFSCIKTSYLSTDMKKSNAFDESLFKRNWHTQKVVSHLWRYLTQMWQRRGRIEVCKITCVQTTLWHLDCLLSLPGNCCQGHCTRSAWVHITRLVPSQVDDLYTGITFVQHTCNPLSTFMALAEITSILQPVGLL